MGCATWIDYSYPRNKDAIIVMKKLYYILGGLTFLSIWYILFAWLVLYVLVPGKI